MDDSEIEIIDPDTYKGGKSGEAFSHSQLIMIALKKCIEAGCVEMREGWVNKKRDKFGNVMETYIPDTRLTFIETVETLMMIISDDLDNEANTNIKNIKDKLEKNKKIFLGLQKIEWEKINYNVKQNLTKNKGVVIREGVLNQFFPYYVEYLIEKVSAYRNIVAELKKLTKRKDYYREEFYEA